MVVILGAGTQAGLAGALLDSVPFVASPPPLGVSLLSSEPEVCFSVLLSCPSMPSSLLLPLPVSCIVPIENKRKI